MAVTASQKNAAEKLGVTPRTLRDWQELPGFPDCSRGYDLAAIQAWRQQHERKGSEPEQAAKKLKLGLLAEKLKQAQFRTKKDQLDLETKEGTLIPRKGVEQTAAVIMSSLGDWCDQFPDLLAGICCRKCAKKVADRIKQELDGRREQMADDLKSLGPS